MDLKSPDKASSLYFTSFKLHLSNKYFAQDIIYINLTTVSSTSFTTTTTRTSAASRKERAAAPPVILLCTRSLSK
jgi:hypothetical protein